jgi:hypothetical protein
MTNDSESATTNVVVAFDTQIQPDPGLPHSFILADDKGHTVLLFRAYVPGKGNEPFTCVIKFLALALKYGYPNNEALPAHPLYDDGLEPDGIFEVLHSTWLSELETQNERVFNTTMYRDYRHIVVTFHESMFEVLTKSIDISSVQVSVPEAAAQLLSASANV